MNAIVIYESLTGNTKKAAEFIVDELISNGVAARSCPTSDVDYQALAEADLVIVGSWRSSKRSSPIGVPRLWAEWRYDGTNFRKAVPSSLLDCLVSSPSDRLPPNRRPEVLGSA